MMPLSQNHALLHKFCADFEGKMHLSWGAVGSVLDTLDNVRL